MIDNDLKARKLGDPVSLRCGQATNEIAINPGRRYRITKLLLQVHNVTLAATRQKRVIKQVMRGIVNHTGLLHKNQQEGTEKQPVV